ncbi:MAG: hypothetical protein ACI9X4_000189 [Glaciecola sp.]|jgi:hypothetical protein
MQSPFALVRRIPLFVAALVALVPAVHAQVEAPRFEKLKDSMVSIEILRDGVVVGTGAGFYIGKHQVLTNHHVLDVAIKNSEGTALRVQPAHGPSFAVQRMLTANSLHDVLVLAVEVQGPPLALAQRGFLARPGAQVFSLGRPAEDQVSMLEGRVLQSMGSTLEREGRRVHTALGFARDEALQGAPVCDRLGQVYGVVLGKSEDGESTLAANTRALLDAVAMAKGATSRSILKYIEQRIAAPGIPGEVLRPTDKGVLTLPAGNSTTHGKRLQLERKGLYHCVGFWTEGEDYLSWEVDLPQASVFSVDMFTACSPGAAGTPVSFGLDEQVVRFGVPATQSFTDFQWGHYGRLQLPSGRSTVTLRALKKPGYAVMDLDRIVLSPVDAIPFFYRPTQLPERVQDLYLEDGKLDSDVVLLVIQGGPMPDVKHWPLFEEWKQSLHLVYVHQAQTLNPSIRMPGFGLDDASHELAVSTEIIDRVAQHFRGSKKIVLAHGASYGAYLLQEFLAERACSFDAIGVAAFRLDSEPKWWSSVLAGDALEFDYARNEWTWLSHLHGYDETNAAGLLIAEVGRQRYTQRLAAKDLSHVVFHYSDRDQTLGTPAPDEIKFLAERGAVVLSEEGLLHHHMVGSKALGRMLKKLLELASSGAHSHAK